MSSSDDGDDMSFYDTQTTAGESEGEDETRAEEAMTSVPASASAAGDWPARGSEPAQLNIATTPTAQTATTTPIFLRRKSSNAKSQNRHSLPEPVPAIPSKFLVFGKRATVTQSPRKESFKQANAVSSPTLHVQRPSTAGGEVHSAPKYEITADRLAPDTKAARRKSLPSLVVHLHRDTLDKLESRRQRRKSADMSRAGRSGGNEDLFLELANDQAEADDTVRPASRGGARIASRLSFSDKRRSLPADVLLSSADRRPKSSGHVFGNRALTGAAMNGASDLQRHMDRYRSTPFQADDAMSMSSRSRSGKPSRYVVAPERSPSLLADQLRSPELPQYGRRRPSFGATSQPPKTRQSHLSNVAQDALSESPAEGEEQKQSLPDSASVDSQTDTVWDELDDLKSRIKKLELTGKVSATSPAAVSNETSERPRTATTAPTTIDSSPKHEKHEKPAKQVEADADADAEPAPENAPAEASADHFVGGPNAANIHPFLHSALAKAKPLLNPGLYRSLEATAADALQLAALTGSAGPQGTAYTAAAIINGVTVSDRLVRRKADMVCRNLTDLCLALCEGRHEAQSVISSPVMLETPAKSSPSIRFPRASLSPHDVISRNGSRPMSRLEARRASVFGSQAGSSVGHSPLESGEELSASEQESTPSHSHLKIQEMRRVSRPASRLQAARLQRYEDNAEDEDPTIRPVSRAVTDAGREKRLSSREFHTPQQQRSPSLRESVARRVNSASHDSHRELPRVTSLSSDSGSRRRFHEYSTPPVREEEEGGANDEYHPASQPKRRITSFGQFGQRRAVNDLPSRAFSLSQRRAQVGLE